MLRVRILGWGGDREGELSPGPQGHVLLAAPCTSPRCWGWDQCFMLSGCLILLFVVFISLHLAADGLFHARAFFFSPPCLHQAHKMCKSIVSFFQAWIFFFPSPVLLCQGRISFSCLLLCVCF